ncbi:MAG: transposase [Akkermansiaceae bacterium]|jgi:putative transposase|tara:strand:+ start:1041 stop:1502 length:462 start_codon:yes stop_codon:yes gene_type:complete
MPQSLNKVILHMVFSTKDRLPLIDPEIRPHLHAYIATILRNISPPQSHPYRVGGVADHVHIACTLPRTVTISKLFEITKKESSVWIKKQGAKYENFYWQAGYGNFSVAPSQLDQLIGYIENQEKHHQTVSFQDEFREFLNKYQIEYDERYVWD